MKMNYFGAIRHLLLIACMSMLGLVNVEAQDSLMVDDVVITGTRFAVPVEKSGKTIYTLDSELISQNAGKTVSDLINTVPGIHIDGNYGTPGTNISYSSRGGRNKQVLILIDGIPVTDPSGIEAFYDLRLLGVDQVETIEVLKGGLSTLYGTGASTAVINVKLKNASKEVFGGNIDLHAGSFGSVGGSATISGQSGSSSYYISGGIEHSDGLSAASDMRSLTPFEKDAFDQQNLLAKYGYKFSDQFKIDIIGIFNDFDVEYDDGAFTDGDNKQLVDEIRVGVTPTYQYDHGQVALKTSFSTAERSFQSAFPQNYKTKNLQMDLYQEHRFGDHLKGFWGLQLQQLSYAELGTEHDDTRVTMVDPYASVVLNLEGGLNVHAGLRMNTHSNYGSELVYNLNPSFLWHLGADTKLKLQASVATSYNTPSLYQLHTPFFGNADLTPERSSNYEFGASIYLNDEITINVAYFNRHETNPIEFVSQFDDMGNFTGGSYGVTDAVRDVHGVEIDFNWELSDKFVLTGNYTNIGGADEASLYRLPRHKSVWGLQYVPSKNLTLRLDYNYTGARKTFDFFSFEEVEMGSFSVLDLYAQYKLLSDKLTIYGAINNLANADYVGVFGFTTKGRNVNAGVKYSF